MKTKDEFRLLSGRVNHQCFGCSPLNPSGLQMKFHSNGETVMSRLTVPGHLVGWSKLVHGGVLSTIMDEIMTWSAIHLMKKVTVTKSMTIEFIKPVLIGDELRAEGKVSELKGKNEVVMEASIYNPKDELCTKSQGTFALIKPRVAQRMGVVDEETLDALKPLLEGLPHEIQ